MESEEVLMNGGVSNGGDDIVYKNGLGHLNGEKGLVEVGGGEMGKANLADEVLEDLEEYWDDINDRLMVSRMVSDSVIKGMVTAVEQEAAERIALKELEMGKLKKFLQSREVGRGTYGNARNWRFSGFADACVGHEKMREHLHALRSLASEQFKKAEKEIECTVGSNSMKKIGSGSELVGLGGILQEKQSESWMHVLESLKTTMETVCTKVDAILLSSRNTFCESQQDLDILVKVEDLVMRSVLRSVREEFEANLVEKNARVCEFPNLNWHEKFNNISGLGSQLDAILKSLTVSETGSVSHGSQDLDHLHNKALSKHVNPTTSVYGENGAVDASSIHVAESYDVQQLKHMPKEELVNYFNNVITKIKRDHEAVIQQNTEEYFRVKREYLKERGSFMAHRKDEEFDVLRRKIPEVISKLEDFLLENEKFPALTNNLDSREKMKERLESLLSENRQLRECLTDKTNEVKCLEAQVLEQTLAEENMRKLVENLKSAKEDSSIEALLHEEVYKSALREQIAQKRWESEAETAKRNESEDSDMESLAMQELSGLIFMEAIKDAEKILDNLYQEVLVDKEARISLVVKALKLENELRLEVEEKEKLKQEILNLEAAMKQKENLATDLEISLSNEREQFELASRELSSLREQVTELQKLASESNMGYESLRSQFLKALEQINVGETEMNMLSQKLAQTKEGLREACEERHKATTLAQEMRDKLLLSEARTETLKQEMELAANGLSKMFEDFEARVAGAIRKNKSRLEDSSSHLKDLTKMVNELRRKGLMYKQKLDRRCTDLQMAESEVDLLGDEVDALLRLLEKIFIALDHYSPVLKHYPGIIEILELVKRELTGQSTKLS